MLLLFICNPQPASVCYAHPALLQLMQIYKKSMTPEEFKKKIALAANGIKRYHQNKLPSVMGNTALRFIDGNFRAQGFQGSTFKKWTPSKKNGTTLVKTGNLRAATHYVTSTGEVKIVNPLPYAAAHNDGVNKTVTVKSHTRNKYSSVRSGTGRFTRKGKERMQNLTSKSGESNVRSHSRKVNLPKRQFIPKGPGDSPVLEKAIVREVTNDIIKIIL